MIIVTDRDAKKLGVSAEALVALMDPAPGELVVRVEQYLDDGDALPQTQERDDLSPTATPTSRPHISVDDLGVTLGDLELLAERQRCTVEIAHDTGIVTVANILTVEHHPSINAAWAALQRFERMQS